VQSFVQCKVSLADGTVGIVLEVWIMENGWKGWDTGGFSLSGQICRFPILSSSRFTFLNLEFGIMTSET
jgi:hypothetical protein